MGDLRLIPRSYRRVEGENGLQKCSLTAAHSPWDTYTHACEHTHTHTHVVHLKSKFPIHLCYTAMKLGILVCLINSQKALGIPRTSEGGLWSCLVPSLSVLRRQNNKRLSVLGWLSLFRDGSNLDGVSIPTSAGEPVLGQRPSDWKMAQR